MLYTKLAGTPDERYEEISILLSIKKDVARKYCSEARRSEVEQQKNTAWDRWLDCQSYREIAAEIDGPDEDTIGRWISAKRNEFQNADAPGSRQHFDIWNFSKSDSDSTAWDMWLNCHTQQKIADEIGVVSTTIANWISKFGTNSKFGDPPDSRQHFDIWNFSKSDSDSTYFGQMPPRAPLPMPSQPRLHVEAVQCERATR